MLKEVHGKSSRRPGSERQEEEGNPGPLFVLHCCEEDRARESEQVQLKDWVSQRTLSYYEGYF